MTRAILIDTDPGLDDAIAILLVLADAAFDLRGVTTVAGNLGLAVTTANAGRLLALAGRGDVPLHQGAASPMARTARNEARIHGADGLGGTPLPDPVPVSGRDAVGFLTRTLTAAPSGSIDLFCLGPLTNLARLVLTAPEAVHRLGRVIAMGGALDVAGNVGPRSEFNLAHDPEAAEIVLGADIDLTLVPLDTTRQVRADAVFLHRLDGGGAIARTSSALIRAYFEERDDLQSRPLHDPMVPLLAVRPDLFRVETRELAIDLDRDPGALYPGSNRVRVALAPDAPALLDLIARRLIDSEPRRV